MALTLPGPPEHGIDIVRANAPLLMGEMAFGEDSHPEVGAPWPVYVSTIQNLRENHVTEGSVLAAWLYPILSGEEIVAIAEVRDSPVEWSALHPRPYATELSNAIIFAESETRAVTREMRILHVPSASLHVLWLHGAVDKFVPIFLHHSLHDQRRMMTEEETFESVKGIIPERLRATGNLGA